MASVSEGLGLGLLEPKIRFMAARAWLRRRKCGRVQQVAERALALSPDLGLLPSALACDDGSPMAAIRYRVSLLVTCFSLLVMLAAYRSATELPDALSPEGCRMSYMWPSYVLQTDFNSSWTPLSRRYTLWLYREAGWEKPDQVRVLIPSSHVFTRLSLASRCPRPVYTRKCRFFQAGALHSIFRLQAVLHFAKRPFRGLLSQRCRGSGRVHGCG